VHPTPPVPMPSHPQVNLQSCADEPIHIPGSIQPHGALLFFDTNGSLEGFSANAPQLLQLELILGASYRTLALPPETIALIADCVAAGSPGPAAAAAIEIGPAAFDCVVHAYGDRLIVEFEKREVPAAEVAMFAVKAHGTIDRLRRQTTVQGLLEIAVQQVRAVTGFDRVMAYRFRHDDSGDVVAESRREDLTPYLGQRYPASDIPAQARRLYVLNSLRFIADATYQAVPLLGAPGAAPLDMSFAMLRSVSPIHVEYLKNMGVAASMSISIVVNGKLWGLIACHHMAPRRVPYAIRMAADVLAQVIASTIQSIEANEQAALIARSGRVRSGVVESLLGDDELIDVLAHHARDIISVSGSQALLCAHEGRRFIHGDLDGATANAIIASLPADATDLLHRNGRSDWPQAQREAIGKWVGMLALPFDPPGGWHILLREEQVEQVAWGGRPDKQEEVGPNGARLTPRGSFDAWYETVRGCAQPWEDAVLANARLFFGELVRAINARRAQTEAARSQLLAMLGHDLRDPLNSINMAGMVLERNNDQPTLGRRIRSSTNRMQQLISQVLDMSRIDRGMGLGVKAEAVDLVPLVDDLVDEARTGHPGTIYNLRCDPSVVALADAARFSQVLSNLLSNARHHGAPGQPIGVRLFARGGLACLEVANKGDPIADDLAPVLFNPFKRASLDNPRNRGGMGLGLYIASQIVQEHGGEINYHYANEQVVFTVTLPLAQVG
jgi:two-component system, chemotaxis family, sensor kinase Cph1